MFSAQELMELTSGRWWPSPPTHGPARIAHDTRHPLSDGLFVAMAGQHCDGHDLLDQAKAAGATMALVTRRVDHSLPQLQVKDSVDALAALAQHWRSQLPRTQVIAITGTAGKTTTKNLLHHVLRTQLRGTASPASWNNAIGGPLSLLRARPEDDYVILEAGTNHPGEIAALGRVMQPDIAVITLVGHGHLEGLGSLEGVRAEKYALLRHVRPTGLALVHADRGVVNAAVRCLRYGTSAEASPRLVSSSHGALELDDGTAFRFSWPGQHQAVNALAVITVARELGLSDPVIDEALSTAEPPEARGESTELAGIRVVNDAYNANPESMHASLSSFAQAFSGRRVVILGDMLELGSSSAVLHRGLASSLQPMDAIFLLGPEMRALAEALDPDSRVRYRPSTDDTTLREISKQLRPGDMVLLKGSRGMGLERILDHLRVLDSEGSTP